MTPARMREYFATRYSADNTMVALAGAVDFDAAVEWISSRCGDWPATDPARIKSAPKTRTTAFTESSERVHRAYTLRVSGAPGAGDPERYAAALLAQILGSPDNSRLHWALIESGVADEALAFYDGLDGAGDMLVYASGDPDRIEEIDAIIDRQCDELADSITEEDLAKLRAKMLTSATVGGERPGGRMQRLGRQWTAVGEYLSLEEELDRINAVDIDAVRGVLGRWPLEHAARGRMTPITGD